MKNLKLKWIDLKWIKKNPFLMDCGLTLVLCSSRCMFSTGVFFWQPAAYFSPYGDREAWCCGLWLDNHNSHVGASQPWEDESQPGHVSHWGTEQMREGNAFSQTRNMRHVLREGWGQRDGYMSFALVLCEVLVMLSRKQLCKIIINYSKSWIIWI